MVVGTLDEESKRASLGRKVLAELLPVEIETKLSLTKRCYKSTAVLEISKCPLHSDHVENVEHV